MVNWDAISRMARECHTKQAWELFMVAHGDTVASATQSRGLAEIYRHLKSDPQSLQYDPRLWGALLQGCLSSWNLELGQEIAAFVRKISAPAVSLPAAQLFLDSGMPSLTREIANRALRLTGLDSAIRLRLEMLVASSYAEEGKRSRSIALLGQIRHAAQAPDVASSLSSRERADLFAGMGRMQFLLGRYLQAAEAFKDASTLYLKLSEWESAAKTLFNTAACRLNGGAKGRDEAFRLIEQCRQIAEAHDLHGPLSHCEAAYGLDAYQHGDFAQAHAHLRRALTYLPASDKSYRRLHILSMLAYTYLGMGRLHLARKFGDQTFHLAALDESERFKTRYTALRAELLWEEGDVEAAEELLRRTTASLSSHGVHTLEELATLNRQRLQAAYLDRRSGSGHGADSGHKIDESLRRNHHAWLDSIYGFGMLAINDGRHAEADRLFSDCLTRARAVGDRQHETLGLLGLMQNFLSQRQPAAAQALAFDFEVATARLGDSPLRTLVPVLHAALHYQRGEFAETERFLRLALKAPRQGFVERFVIPAWLATTSGRSPRLGADWQRRVLARATRVYFAPTLEALSEREFRVSEHYVVDLRRQPRLAEILLFLMHKNRFSAEVADIQTSVWRESLNAQGWQQKIRNANMRLRDLFPQTIAPIIIHTDSVHLFSEAIRIVPRRTLGVEPSAEVLHLLQDARMSSTDIARRLDISPATAKRLLRRLTENHSVAPIKAGRHVYYTSRPTGAEGPP